MSKIDKPIIHSTGDTYLLTWPNSDIQMRLDRLVEKTEGISAELLITKAGGHLYQARANLLSSQAKRTIINEMTNRLNGLDWRILIEQAFANTLELYRQGEPIVQVGNLPKRQKPRYRLKPFVLEDEICALYAYGGAGKSILSDLIAVLVQCGYSACGLTPVKGNVLILDWETSRETVDERIKAIKKGMGIDSPELPYYRRFYHLLANDIYQIQEEVAQKDIKLAIVDSANMAGGIAGGDFHGPAQAMLSAIRSLHVSTLIIDHKPKVGDTMFGTIIKFNTCRSAFELKGNQEEGSSELDIALFHTKHNDTPKFKSMGFKVTFYGDDESIDEIAFKRQEVADIPVVNEGLSLSERILNILKHGAYTAEEVAEQMDITKNIAGVSLSRLKKRGLITKVGINQWGLSFHGEKEGNNN